MTRTLKIGLYVHMDEIHAIFGAHWITIATNILHHQLLRPGERNCPSGVILSFSAVILSASEGSHAPGHEILRWRSGWHVGVFYSNSVLATCTGLRIEYVGSNEFIASACEMIHLEACQYLHLTFTHNWECRGQSPLPGARRCLHSKVFHQVVWEGRVSA